MTFGPVFQRVFQPTFDRRNSAGAWWNLFGAIPLTNCVAAYAAKGAVDQAASYVNLVTPGTYNAAPGTAPTWDATNGWKFSTASSQYLDTGITQSAVAWTVILRFSNMTNTDVRVIFGAVGGGPVRNLELAFDTNVNDRLIYGNGGSPTVTATPKITSGVIGIANKTAYRNGASDGTIGAGTSLAALTLYIGALNAAPAAFFISAYVQALAIYNNSQASNMAALTVAINAL